MLGIVIQARMNSSRLPGKVLMDFCGKPMLLFQVALLRRFNLGAEIVIATTENPLDDQIEALCKENHIRYVRGSEENVFQRFRLVVERFQFDHVVRLTGDNPLTDYRVLKACLKKHLETLPDLTSTRRILPDRSIERYVPKGNSVDVINCQTLLSIDPEGLDDFQREHVIPVFFDRHYTVSLVEGFTFSHASITVDDAGDFERVSRYVQDLLERDCLLEELGFVSRGKLHSA